jgi:hypothetical protein
MKESNNLSPVARALQEFMLKQDDPDAVMCAGNRKWTARELAEEIENQTDEGIDLENNIIKLTIHLLFSGKETIDGIPLETRLTQARYIIKHLVMLMTVCLMLTATVKLMAGLVTVIQSVLTNAEKGFSVKQNQKRLRRHNVLADSRSHFQEQTGRSSSLDA